MAQDRRPISHSGRVSLIMSAIVEPISNRTTVVTNISFANENENTSYKISLYKSDYKGDPILMYRLALDPGDIVNDSTTYYLDDKTKIWAVSDRNSIAYHVGGYIE